MKNLITDVAGVRVGHADDAKLASGATVVVFDKPPWRHVDVRGGGPGTRETARSIRPRPWTHRRHRAVGRLGLRPRCRLRRAGLSRRTGPRLPVRDAVVPIVPGAILFRSAQRRRQGLGPLPALSRAWLRRGRPPPRDFALGSVGAGLGATTANLKGGLGSASAQTRGGITVGALVVVNAVGSVTVGDGPYFWAAPFELDAEFGGCGLPPSFPRTCDDPHQRRRRTPGEYYARRDRDRCGFDQSARQPARDDGADRLCARDLSGAYAARWRRLFAAATGEKPIDPLSGLTELGMVAANVMARAIARGIYEATALPFPGALPAGAIASASHFSSRLAHPPFRR